MDFRVGSSPISRIRRRPEGSSFFVASDELKSELAWDLGDRLQAWNASSGGYETRNSYGIKKDFVTLILSEGYR